jgi:hypothetical protein
MSLRAPKQEKTNFAAQPNLEPGSYPARVARVYGAGRHPVVFQGEVKAPKLKIWVVYELVDAYMVDENGDEMEGKPRWITESFNLSPITQENAKSTMRYKGIDPTLKFDGDWSQLVGMPVSVTVVNNAKGGKVYDNVGGVTAVRPRDIAKIPDLVNEGFFFDPSEPNLEYFNKIPKFIQDDIKASIDFPGSELERLLGGFSVPEKQAPKQEAEPVDDTPDDDMPW